MLVPPQVAREASTATALRHAVRAVPAEETSTLDDIVACLQARRLRIARTRATCCSTPPRCRWQCSSSAHHRPALSATEAALTVITMAGLRLPDLKIEREYWSAEEQLALPMLHTAHRLAVRRCYGGSMESRKLVGLDEAHFMEGWRSGRSFLVRLARDSRKWNLAALVASQNPRDILGLDVQNLVSTVFVGRIAEDTEIAAEALRLLRVPGRRRIRGGPRLPVPRRHQLIDPARLPRVRHARRRRSGAEDPGRRVMGVWTAPGTSTPRQPASIPPPSQPRRANDMAGQPRASHLERRYALLLALFILAIGVVAFPSRPAVAGPVGQAPTAAPSGLCTVEEWQADLTGCVNRLSDVAAQRAQCLKAPIPETPDSGLAGWFASRPEARSIPEKRALYTTTVTPDTHIQHTILAVRQL